MLKQQISVYADDFANERSDRERIQADREAQKERLKEIEREIPLLKQQVNIVEFRGRWFEGGYPQDSDFFQLSEINC